MQTLGPVTKKNPGALRFDFPYPRLVAIDTESGPQQQPGQAAVRVRILDYPITGNQVLQTMVMTISTTDYSTYVQTEGSNCFSGLSVGDATGGREEELILPTPPGSPGVTVGQCLKGCRDNRGADGFTIENSHGQATFQQVASSYRGRCWCEFGNTRNNGNVAYRTARIHPCGERETRERERERERERQRELSFLFRSFISFDCTATSYCFLPLAGSLGFSGEGEQTIGDLFTDGKAAFFYRAERSFKPFNLVTLDEGHIQRDFVEEILPAAY